MDTIGTRIEALRKKNETQQQLAEALGVSRSLVKAWETGIRRIQIDDLLKLAEHFNVTTDYLLGLTTVKNTDADLRTAEKVTGLRAESLKQLSALKDFDPTAIILLDAILMDYPGCLSAITRYVSLSQSALRVHLNDRDDSSQSRAEQLTMLQGIIATVGKENVTLNEPPLPSGSVILSAKNASDFYKQEASRIFIDFLNDFITNIANAEIGKEWRDGEH